MHWARSFLAELPAEVISELQLGPFRATALCYLARRLTAASGRSDPQVI